MELRKMCAQSRVKQFLISLKQLMLDLTVLHIFLTWLLKFNCESRIIPKYFSSDTCSMVCPFIWTCRVAFKAFVMEKQIHLVFCRLRVRQESWSQAEILFRLWLNDDCRVYPRNMNNCIVCIHLQIYFWTDVRKIIYIQAKKNSCLNFLKRRFTIFNDDTLFTTLKVWPEPG